MTEHKIVFVDSRSLSRLHLIVTSPPYRQLKDYGYAEQTGFNDSYEEHINNINLSGRSAAACRPTAAACA